jgi:pimeloyl-ACP methyl ester carboxylesterase
VVPEIKEVEFKTKFEDKINKSSGLSSVSVGEINYSKSFEQRRLALFEHYGFKGESRRVSNKEGKITYMISHGEGSHPTMFVHGGISEASELCLLAPHIPGYVLIPDRPGYGLSYPINYFKVDYRETVSNWLLDLFNGIGVEKVDLVAHSMGGFCAIVFAIAHPERVSRLVLVGAPAGLDK